MYVVSVNEILYMRSSSERSAIQLVPLRREVENSELPQSLLLPSVCHLFSLLLPQQHKTAVHTARSNVISVLVVIYRACELIGTFVKFSMNFAKPIFFFAVYIPCFIERLVLLIPIISQTTKLYPYFALPSFIIRYLPEVLVPTFDSSNTFSIVLDK